MQNARHADLRAEALWIGRDCHHRFRRRSEQQAVDRLFVPIGDLDNLRGHREDDVEVLDREQILGAGLHPVTRGRSLTLGTMPVLATVVGDVVVIALGARGHMPAEHLGSAGLNR